MPSKNCAVGEALPLLAPPRLGGDQRSRPVRARRRRAATRGTGKIVTSAERDGRTLVVDAELGDAVDLVAPQVDADRRVGRRREHVDDGTAHRDLAAVLDLILAAIAEPHELLDELGGVDHVAGADDDGFDARPRADRGAAPARAPRRRSPRALAPGRAAATTCAARCAMVSTLGLTRSNGSVSHAGNDVDVIGAEEEREVVDQPIGVGGGRHGHDDRPSLGSGEPARRWPRPVPARVPPAPRCAGRATIRVRVRRSTRRGSSPRSRRGHVAAR